MCACFSLQLQFLFDNGPGSVTVEYIPANTTELCDGRSHVVVVDKNAATGTLMVDQANTVSRSSPFLEFAAVNTNDPLYIGGVPGETLTCTHRL